MLSWGIVKHNFYGLSCLGTGDYCLVETGYQPNYRVMYIFSDRFPAYFCLAEEAEHQNLIILFYQCILMTCTTVTDDLILF